VKIKPPSLQKGGKIGIIAPAGPVSESDLVPAIKRLSSYGYRVLPATHLYDRSGYLAGDDLSRLEDLHAMFQDEDVKAIFCARGGYGTLRLLDRIDFDLIRKNPKILVGYSDITALLLGIYSKTGLITFHGPMVKEIADKKDQDLGLFFDLVSHGRGLEMDLSEGIVLVEGRGAGTLLGGNLTLVSHLIGTPFMPSLNKAILFIEERGEPLYRIDRILTHLRLGGFLERLSGLIAGSFIDCGDATDLNRLLKETLSPVGIPLVSGLPFGHGKDNAPLPVGMQAVLDTTQMTLSIRGSAVRV